MLYSVILNIGLEFRYEISHGSVHVIIYERRFLNFPLTLNVHIVKVTFSLKMATS